MNKRAVLCIASIIALTVLASSQTGFAVEPILLEEQGSLRDLIEKFRAGIIPRDSGKYVTPTWSDLQSTQNAFSVILNWMNSGSDDLIPQAVAALAGFNYVLVRFSDISGKVFYVAREAPGYNRGWGLYVVHVRAPCVYRRLLVEVPHIGFDEFTERIGVRCLLQSYAGFFLVAGAHRYANPDAAADVAHTEQCVFHVVHKVWCTNGSTALQIHGFAETSAGREQYPQVILSSGTPEGSIAVRQMSDALTMNGLTVGIFDGTKYTDLGATTNVQGQYARSAGASFIHMEIARAVRSSDELSGKIVKAVEQFTEQSVIEVPEFRFFMPVLLTSILVSCLAPRARRNTRS